nr:beta-ketoacyl synthase N-terminal-like domain-containing protein [Kibdelosporangium sp. MJ126-NF4]CEL17432.1 3-oxoacyl-[acyl-carrier-protein] synthase, KASII [Kibdelosporangium sp. MJ126-NF4]CTQ91341.1 3-oxoacyl-[acyl-carrier-protein] synthase, KASII (EC 2.3.1.179) [Kibdelosporangium sp. MJ126-NF4]
MRRVVVTGVSLLTALGTDTWKRLLAGDSGIRPIRAYDPGSFRTRLAAEIDDFVPENYATRRLLRTTTRGDQLAIAGAALAVSDAGLDGYEPDRTGVFVGGGKEISKPERLLEGSLAARGPDGEADFHLLGERATSAFYPLYYVEGLQSAALYYISHAHGFTGPNAYFHGESAGAIGRAFRSIRRGECDAAVAGGFDDATSWWTVSKMDSQLGGAYRPFDVDRDGPLLGEGAAFLVLEEFDAAAKRGAHVYAEITGHGSTFGPTRAGAALTAAINAAGGWAADYVAADGAATRRGDVSEAMALASTGNQCASSVKPAVGHLLAAAGAVNAAVCALAIDQGAVPPTLNLDNPDPRCPLDWVPREARAHQVHRALAVARGMQGQQVALAFRAAKGAGR